MISEEKARQLLDEAIEAQKSAYVPYSNFYVGAALLTKDGKIYRGCNIENAAYGPTNCAERTAFFKAVSEGDKKFDAIAIVGGSNLAHNETCPPCGVCRQVMREFCKPDQFRVLLGTSPDDCKSYLLEELLPVSFGPENLQEA